MLVASDVEVPGGVSVGGGAVAVGVLVGTGVVDGVFVGDTADAVGLDVHVEVGSKVAVALGD